MLSASGQALREDEETAAYINGSLPPADVESKKKAGKKGKSREQVTQRNRERSREGRPAQPATNPNLPKREQQRQKAAAQVHRVLANRLSEANPGPGLTPDGGR